MMKPSITRNVLFRSDQGRLQAAIVTATVDTVAPADVEFGTVPALDSDTHVHLRVFPPDDADTTVHNVAQSRTAEVEPGTWAWDKRG